MVNSRIGPYLIRDQLGEGGMGVVYAAHDERLDRSVAIKMIKPSAADDAHARERFRREARAVASLNHPNICQLFDIGEHEGSLYLAMELLDGEPLDRRMQRGAMPLPDAIATILAVLSALDQLHARGLVHRDLKPSNIFLTPHGVKLLDFGIARGFNPDTAPTLGDLTLPGIVLGSPRYMAPEQLLGRGVDARSDIYAAGAILFEMLAGRPAHVGSLVDVAHAVLHERPPVLSGSTAIAAADRVVHRAMARKPADRYPTAAEMSQDLREVAVLRETGEMVKAHTVTRLVVLPFRVLRPDPDIDFLAFGLADALTSSLSGLDSLVVRSTLAAQRFAQDSPDLAAIASELEVDSVLTGTLLRGGDRLRITTQLVEAPAGTVLWSHTAQTAMGDLFAVQDELVSRIVESLALPLSAREQRALKKDVPSSATAYELYLRANEIARDARSWHVARDLYRQAVELDEGYAPAWARLGRMYRVIAKFFASEDAVENERNAEAALNRALELNPDLSVAHKVYAQLEVDLGHARDAMTRLLERARLGSADQELFVGLSQACRYCGLLKASVAAHERARRLDPNMPTGVAHTFWMMADYERALEVVNESTDAIEGVVLASLGRIDEAIVALTREHARFAGTVMGTFLTAMQLAIERRGTELRDLVAPLRQTGFRDPEGTFYIATFLFLGGEGDEGFEWLQLSVDRGFACYPALVRTPWLDPYRTQSRFQHLFGVVEARHVAARAAYLDAGGERILGPGTS